MKSYLVTKAIDPNTVPGMTGHLSPLFSDIEHVLMDHPGELVVERMLTEEEVPEVESRGHILAVEPNYTAKTPKPPAEFQAAAATKLTAAQARTLHGVDKVHALGTRGSKSRVAVIDTGCHEKLAERLGARVVARESVVPGEDWKDNFSDSHGSWIISVIAAIAPGCEIVVIKALSSYSGSGTYSGIIKAIEMARALGCTHINLSLGGPASYAVDSAVNSADAAGLLVAVAAGNEQEDSGMTLVADQSSPARAAGAVTVAAAGSDMLVAAFSNMGVCLDISAVGVYAECADPDIIPGFWNGTSMAAPYLCGIAALLNDSVWLKDAIKKGIYSSARDTSEPVEKEGVGFADAQAALVKLMGEGYFPHLPRVAKSRVDDIPQVELADFVMTYNRVDIGRFERKL